MIELEIIPNFPQNHIFDNVFYINGKTKAEIWNWKHFSTVYESESRIGLLLLRGILLVYDTEKAILLSEPKTKEIYFEKADIRQIKDLKNASLIARELIDEQWGLVIYKNNEPPKRIRFQRDLSFLRLFENYHLFLISSSEIILLNIDSQKVIWRVSLQEVFNCCSQVSIKGSIIFKDSHAYISGLSEKGDLGTVCIDHRSGKLKGNFPQLKGWLLEKGDHELISTSGMINSNQFLNHFNIQTGKFNQINLSEIIPPNWSIEHNKSSVTQSDLYFAARENLTLPSIIGKINLNTFILEDSHELLFDESKLSVDENRYSIMKIYSVEGKVGVYTSHKTLHIFSLANQEA